MKRQNRLHELEQQVAHLEQQIAYLQSAAPHPSAAGTTLLAPVRIVDTEGNRLVDIQRHDTETRIDVYTTQAQLAASLGVDTTQAGYLMLYDGAGNRIVSVHVAPVGVRLELHDPGSNAGIVLFGNDDEGLGGGITLRTSSGECFSICAEPDQDGVLKLYGSDGAVLASFPPRDTQPGK